jgi:hypothetical protein
VILLGAVGFLTNHALAAARERAADRRFSDPR